MRLLVILFFLSATAVFGNSYSMTVIDLPKAEDITAFTNGLLPSSGKRIYKTKEEILYFLQHAKYSDKYLRDDRAPVFGDSVDTSDGVFVDKAGKFYFWYLVSPTILRLQTPEGGAAILKLDKPK